MNSPAPGWTGPRLYGHPDVRTWGAQADTHGQWRFTTFATKSSHAQRLPEGYAFPAFVDAHTHLTQLGAHPHTLTLAPDAPLTHIQERLSQAAAAQAPGTWIVGQGWLSPCGFASDGSPLPPTKHLLDAHTPHHPVALIRGDAHALWANSAALAAAGLNAQCPAPPGGAILRDPDGTPSGLLLDAAMAPIQALLPRPSPTQSLAIAQDTAAQYLALGVTCVHDMATEAHLLQSLAALPIRVRAYLIEPSPLPEPTPWWHHCRPCGYKAFADGALGSQGAKLSWPYPDGSTGVEPTAPPQRRALYALAHHAGVQMAVHAIGDQALAQTLADFARLGVRAAQRWRVEHAQVIPDALLPALAQVAHVSVQPQHAVDDLPWAQGVLAPGIEGAYRWASLRAAGIPMGLGTDFPIASLDPRRTLFAACTRQGRAGGPVLPGEVECLERQTALAAMTADAAALAGDDDLGRLAPGALADFAVWDRDLARCPAAEILDAQCLAVVVNGALVYTR